MDQTSEVWAQIGKKLRELRTGVDYKQADFAKELGMSTRSYSPIEAGEPPKKSSEAKLRRGLASKQWMEELSGLFGRLDKIGKAFAILQDFDSLASVLRRVDQSVLKVVRAQDRDFLSEEEMADEHRVLLNGKLAESGLTTADLIVQLADGAQTQRLAETIPEPGCIVEVGDGVRSSRFARVAFHCRDKTLLDLRDARLLWDCSCTSRTARDKNCRIHSPPNVVELEQKFFNELVEIRWRGFRFLWRNGPESWPPSIDAFLMASTLRVAGAFDGQCRTLLDIGSGTGFLSIVAAHFSEKIETVAMWDWLLTRF